MAGRPGGAGIVAGCSVFGEGLLTPPQLPTGGLQPRPRGRPAVRPGPRNGVGGVWRPAPNSRQLEIRRLFPARS